MLSGSDAASPAFDISRSMAVPLDLSSWHFHADLSASIPPSPSHALSISAAHLLLSHLSEQPNYAVEETTTQGISLEAGRGRVDSSSLGAPVAQKIRDLIDQSKHQFSDLRDKVARIRKRLFISIKAMTDLINVSSAPVGRA